MRDLLLYVFLRVLIFAALWWLLYWIGLGSLALSGIFAAVLAMLVSILVLGRPRQGIALRWEQADARRRARKAPVRDHDADAEDQLIDGSSPEGAVQQRSGENQ
ncbi:DUF4229 domain-containing protein [Devriesea agamarum]|uniref:DUF4229 domain-containing protein n=1 Tax=Devriesea agamarum TaxID=472569 RepID=UPI00071DFC9A|nr:DUF4229 domain-containing protein [Devriesea agamarum]